jgi:hypothetical protein
MRCPGQTQNTNTAAVCWEDCDIWQVADERNMAPQHEDDYPPNFDSLDGPLWTR